MLTTLTAGALIGGGPGRSDQTHQQEVEVKDKLMFIEITKPCFVENKELFTGSIVQCLEKHGRYVIGLGKAKISDAKAEKIVARPAKAPEKPKKEEKEK
jgi:hypothetical protein